MTTMEIKVHHEWGKLKEAIVGTAVSLRVPTRSDDMNLLRLKYSDLLKRTRVNS